MMRPGLFLFICVAHGIDHIFMLLFPAVVGISVADHWGLSYGELLAIFTPAAVMFGLGAPLAGWLADRWSGEGMIAVFFVGIGAAAVLTGLADGPVTLGIGLFLIGTFASIYHPVGIPLIVRGSGEMRGRMLGINGVFGSGGMALTPVIVGGLLMLGGWRLVFILPGIAAIIMGAVFWLGFRDGLSFERKRAASLRPSTDRSEFVRAMVVLGVITVATGLIFQAMTNGLPKIVNHRVSTFGDDAFLLSATASVILAVGGVAQLLGGWLADKFPLRRLFVAVYAAMPPALAAAAVSFDLPLVVILIIAMAVVVGNQPISDSLFARYMPDRWLSTAYGVRFALSLCTGLVALPLVGFGFDLTGDFALLFYVLAAAAVVVVAAAVRLPAERAGQPAPVPAE